MEGLSINYIDSTNKDVVVTYTPSSNILNYSYKIMHQSAGRIDRLNTPYTDLYYYYMKTRSGIDLAIERALNEKRKFNESSFIKF